MATRSSQPDQLSGSKRPRENKSGSYPQSLQGLRNLSSLRSLLESTIVPDQNADTDLSNERKTKQLFVPTGSIGDSRWRCVPGPFTRQCVEYKVGDVGTSGYTSSMRPITIEEIKRFGDPKNRGIYSDYASKTECESRCETLPTDPLSLALSMLGTADVKNTILATHKFPQVVNALQDSFDEAKEAKNMEDELKDLLILVNGFVAAPTSPSFSNSLSAILRIARRNS